MSGNRLARINRARATLQPLLLGAAHAFSFSDGPLPAWVLPYVQILTLTFLALWMWRASSWRRAAASGLLFGLGNFSLGLYWIYFSLHTYGGMATGLAVSAVLVMSFVLALSCAAACGLSYWLLQDTLNLRQRGQAASRPLTFRRTWLAAALWGSCWMLLEWVRGTWFTGFPWLNVGYGHVDGPLSGWAPVLGVYGLAWIAAFTAGAIALLMKVQDTPDATPAAFTVASTLILMAAGLGLAQIQWHRPLGEPIIVRLVQGNIPQSIKFDPVHLQKGIDAYLHMANLEPKSAQAKPVLIILPETVMPVFQNRLNIHTWQRWVDVAANQNATIMMGTPLNTAPEGVQTYANSVIAFNRETSAETLRQGTTDFRYDKHHLVPFGEFIPTGFRWFVDAMNIPLGDFDRGSLGQPPLALAGQYIAPNICYEDVFGEEIIQAVRSHQDLHPGASMLVNVSNLAWFGESWALQQHLQISRMRAIETARPMLRATNTGMTAAVDADGTVRAALNDHQMGVLDVEVQGTQGLTPYVRWGNWPVLALALLILTIGLANRKRVYSASAVSEKGPFASNAVNSADDTGLEKR